MGVRRYRRRITQVFHCRSGIQKGINFVTVVIKDCIEPGTTVVSSICKVFFLFLTPYCIASVY